MTDPVVFAPPVVDAVPERSAAAPTNDPSPPTRRALRVIVRLEPTGDAGFRARLGVDAAGCDPVFRSLAVDDLWGALAEVSALVDEAEALWRQRPRYPAAPRAAAPRARAAAPAVPCPAGEEPAAPAATAPPGDGPPTAAPPATPTPPTAPPGQLPLFWAAGDPT